MASVTSLDQDMRKLRMDRYTPGAAKEVRQWIEGVLQDDLPAGDLMEALRDGVALCRLVNLVVSPAVKFRQSAMPFVQMENISNFLRACEMPPLKLPSHDRFLTVDLYDQKDPAQVIQCLAAFSRRANAVDPQTFPTTIGAKSRAEVGTSDSARPSSPYTVNSPPRSQPESSPTRSLLARGGLANSSGPVSSWSSKNDETKTAPAWNIHQYGYMGGANQGNQGVSFGGRRQIVSQQPEVPSLAEKEKRLRERLEAEQKSQAEAERAAQFALQVEEKEAQLDEERRWAEATRKAEEQASVAEADQQRSQLDSKTSSTSRTRTDDQPTLESTLLNGQFLSQYHASRPLPQKPRVAARLEPQHLSESERIAELEKQLAEAQSRLAAHETENDLTVPLALPAVAAAPSPSNIPPRPSAPTPITAATHSKQSEILPNLPVDEDEWAAADRDAQARVDKEYRKANQDQALYKQASRTPPPEPRPAFAEVVQPSRDPVKAEPTDYVSNTNRTDRFLRSNPAPAPTEISQHVPAEASFSTTSEVDQENARRLAAQKATRAGGWASKSLLEREMERERERQREWEEAQKEIASQKRDATQGTGPGQSWDVHQYGYMGGDNQNRGSQGIGSTRRQIIGPRPPP